MTLNLLVSQGATTACRSGTCAPPESVQHHEHATLRFRGQLPSSQATSGSKGQHFLLRQQRLFAVIGRDRGQPLEGMWLSTLHTLSHSHVF